MARPKLISDAAILAIVRERVLRAGDKAVSFREVAAATGLSAPALVLRFSSQSAMVSAALVAGWQALGALAASAAQDLGQSPKSMQEFLKLQADFIDIPALLTHSLRDAPAKAAAAEYRASLEGILAQHLGGGIAAKGTAGAIFAAWQGRIAWGEAGGKTYRFGEFLRNVT
ncbi:MAG: hypothetical protein U5N55_04510 [Cypionkella sp.]|nr:hypothetical protein [Cypionkella sp.]